MFSKKYVEMYYLERCKVPNKSVKSLHTVRYDNRWGTLCIKERLSISGLTVTSEHKRVV